MNKIRFALPKGSLEETTIEIFKRAGIEIAKGTRSYFPTTTDEEIEFMMVRPQEMPLYIRDGIFDCGITGYDWILENNVRLKEILTLVYAKSGFQPTRWVLAVPEASSIRTVKQLQGKRIATELVNFTKRYLKKKGVEAVVEFSWGATEAKAPLLCDAICELTETGRSLRENRLRIIEEILVSAPRFVANQKSFNNAWKLEKMENIAMLLEGAMRARGMVGLKMNIQEKNMKKILNLLPSLKNPTISMLTLKGWYALEVILEEKEVQKIIPVLKRNGASGIIEYSLNKLIY